MHSSPLSAASRTARPSLSRAVSLLVVALIVASAANDPDTRFIDSYPHSQGRLTVALHFAVPLSPDADLAVARARFSHAVVVSLAHAFPVSLEITAPIFAHAPPPPPTSTLDIVPLSNVDHRGVTP